MNSTMSEHLDTGIHRLADTVTYICDCDACLRKNKGKPKQVPRTTYFRHKPSRLARIFPPPLPAEAAAPILVPSSSAILMPSSSAMPVPSSSAILVPSSSAMPVPSSSKRTMEAPDDQEQPPTAKHKPNLLDAALVDLSDSIEPDDVFDGTIAIDGTEGASIILQHRSMRYLLIE
jgi:hypothetical protein